MQLQSSFTPLAYSAAQPALAGGTGSFPIEKQIMSNWCWVCCTLAVCRFYGTPIADQYHLVATITGIPRCAVPPPVAVCNIAVNLADPLKYYGHLNQEQDAALSESDTLSYVSDGRVPIGCQLLLPNIGGHAVVIYNGYRSASGQLVLNIADPADGALLTMTYAQLLSNYRNSGGNWIRSYITQ